MDGWIGGLLRDRKRRALSLNIASKRTYLGLHHHAVERLFRGPELAFQRALLVAHRRKRRLVLGCPLTVVALHSILGFAERRQVALQGLDLLLRCRDPLLLLKELPELRRVIIINYIFQKVRIVYGQFIQSCMCVKYVS